MKFEKYRPPVVSETIDGLVYESSKWPATKALTLKARTIRALGERGLQAVVLTWLSEEHKIHNIAQIFPALTRIADGLLEDPALAKDLCSDLKCATLRPAGNPGRPGDHFDSHFAGELPHLFNVLGFVLAHNLAGFTLGSHLLDGSLTSDSTTQENPSS